MRAQEFITEVSTQGGITELERQLDKMFMPLGLDVEFSRHFIERLLGREREITVGEVVAGFQKLKSKYKRQLLKAKKTDAGPGALQDFDSDLNVLFAIQPDKKNNEYDLVNITVKRKDPDEFHTDTPSGNATPYHVGTKK